MLLATLAFEQNTLYFTWMMIQLPGQTLSTSIYTDT